MQREQKTKQGELEFGCPAGERVEPKEPPEARSIAAPEAMSGDSADGRKPGGELLERMLGTENMFLACDRVVRNGGAAGVDGMTVKELEPYLVAYYRELRESIRGGWYKAQPVRRVEIPKPDGGVRLLGVPTVIDRMVQQALVQVLQPVFEPTFSDSSYGFRPRRSAQQAIQRAKGYYEEGYTWVVDLDLEKFFDTVNHDLLIKMVREMVKDETIITLIKKFLKSGVMVDGLVL
jgi:group II intron reverse transcriptase/maturase